MGRDAATVDDSVAHGATRTGSIRVMVTATGTVHLAGEDLRGHRHICALVDGPDAAYDLLLPFVVEGVEQGDRAVHLIDPDDVAAHLDRLRDGGVNVAAATAADRLEIDTWTESYLRGGRFSPSEQLAYLRGQFEEGRRVGAPRTRLIGTMEWAAKAETDGSLLRYESRINDLLRRRSDVVVCVYDLNRHSARTIADMLGAHPVAIVGGVLRASDGRARASAQDRILEAASQLFHESGTRATGVDAIIQAAGVAKATFYRYFPSKDDLVVAWLRDPATGWLGLIRSQSAASRPEPQKAIPRLFDAVGEWLETDGFYGCPYLNTAIEIADPRHPARVIVTEYLQDVEDYLVQLVEAAGHPDSRRLAARLQVLLTGAISLAVARRSRASVSTARDAAVRLLGVSEA
jgi:AcrR family transcriptional regulator